MFARFFHALERRLVAVDTNRVVRPFEWGLDWLDSPPDSPDEAPHDRVARWADAALSDPTWFEPPPCSDYELRGDTLTFPSALDTPHPENNRVVARYFAADAGDGPRRATLVLPQWNADAGGHVGLCRLLAAGISALRLSLPYHDSRMPPELDRADYIVSANVGRTLQVNRQAVLDARRALAWLAEQGYERIGILGTSLGSCLAMLTAAHEPLVKAAALNHISPFFADVVWEGLSTAHVRAGLEGAIDLDRLRRLWLPISPHPYIDRLGDRPALLVYARYDLSFPVHLSRRLITDFEQRGIRHEVTVLPCGHYTTGHAPFKWLDGYTLVKFLRRNL
jgi:dienelactone hydrolase